VCLRLRAMCRVARCADSSPAAPTNTPQSSTAAASPATVKAVVKAGRVPAAFMFVRASVCVRVCVWCVVCRCVCVCVRVWMYG
jgi:hypothetical protein